MAAPNEISCKQRVRRIGKPDCPVIVDISIDPDFSKDPFVTPGSFRHPHTDLDALRARLSGRACIITCQQGIKLSQGLTSRLRGRGVDAQYLEGGMYGWRDDHIQLDAAMPRYDAVYRWVRGGVAETHASLKGAP